MYYFNYSLIGKCVISCALVMRLKDQRRSHTEGVFINALSTIVCFLPTPCLAFICPLLTLLTLYRFSYNKILIWRSPTVGRRGVLLFMLGKFFLSSEIQKKHFDFRFLR